VKWGRLQFRFGLGTAGHLGTWPGASVYTLKQHNIGLFAVHQQHVNFSNTVPGRYEQCDGGWWCLRLSMRSLNMTPLQRVISTTLDSWQQRCSQHQHLVKLTSKGVARF